MHVRCASHSLLLALGLVVACGHDRTEVVGGGAGGATPEDSGSSADAGNWTLVWADEFDKDGFWDDTKWNIETEPPGWVNQELQAYVNRLENARVENGNLVIEARLDNFGGHPYSSARLDTRGRGDLLYGRVEVRAKLPKGRGTWPAIWMMPTDDAYGAWPDSGEIDIMEHVGYDPGVVHATAHCHNFQLKTNNQKTATTTVADFGDAMHVYAFEWFPDRIDMFVDQTKFLSFANDGTGWQSWPFDKRFHVILNVAIGGNWGGAQGVDDSIFPVRMEVDYVRMYQMAP
jgi:beta-glucanase (GH16 family)